MKATASIGGAIDIKPGGTSQIIATHIANILTIQGIAAVVSASAPQRTVVLNISPIAAGTTGTFSLTGSGAFGGFTTSTLEVSSLCTTTKTYNTDAPGGGTLTITEWNTATKTVKGTFSFNAVGEDSGKTCFGGGTTPLGVPTEKPSVTGGSFWVVIQ